MQILRGKSWKNRAQEQHKNPNGKLMFLPGFLGEGSFLGPKIALVTFHLPKFNVEDMEGMLHTAP